MNTTMNCEFCTKRKFCSTKTFVLNFNLTRTSRFGSSVSLTCSLDTLNCGDFHSIKWYKDGQWVSVYSHSFRFLKKNLLFKFSILFSGKLSPPLQTESQLLLITQLMTLVKFSSSSNLWDWLMKDFINVRSHTWMWCSTVEWFNSRNWRLKLLQLDWKYFTETIMVSKRMSQMVS